MAGGGDVADAMSEKIIMVIPEPESNHNGGMLAFGPDRMLYIGVGDGGGGGDRHGENGNGQNLNTLLAKILRIDVDKKAPYQIPADNPFIRQGAKPEIFAYGLRNPWKFSFDMQQENYFVVMWDKINLKKLILSKKEKIMAGALWKAIIVLIPKTVVT